MHGAAACVTVNVCPPAVIVPVRDVVAEFAATVNVTVPLPDPLAPPVIVIQVALLAAVHVQPLPLVTANELVPPPATTDSETGEIEYVHGAAACVTVNVCPPAVIVPVRDVVAEFAATLNVTVPFPDPLAPPVIVIHVALLAAVHAQPLPLVTVNEPVPPPATTDSDTGETEYVHGAAACVTVKIWPAIVSVAVRSTVVVFWATLNATVPLSVPEAPLVTVSHAALLTAVHEHPIPIRSETVPLPPADGKL